MDQKKPVHSHNPYETEGFPLLVLDVQRQVCHPYNEGFRVPHWHQEVQFVHVLKGIVRVRIYEESLDIRAGECLFINRAILHQITEKEDCHYHSFIIPLRLLTIFPGSAMENQDVYAITNNPAFTHCHFSGNGGESGEVLAAVRRLDDLYFKKEQIPHREYALSAALIELWLAFIRSIFVLPSAAPSKDYARIHRLLSFIHDSYDQDISVQEIAAAAAISKTECLRCFRKFIGSSPYQYLMKYRLYMSTALLKNTELTVTDIGAQVGFHSTSSFIQYFQKNYGMTPAAYRHQKED